MHRNSQRIPIRVQCNSIVQLVKKADFLKPAVVLVRLFALRQPVLMTVRRGAFLFEMRKPPDGIKIELS